MKKITPEDIRALVMAPSRSRPTMILPAALRQLIEREGIETDGSLWSDDPALRFPMARIDGPRPPG